MRAATVLLLVGLSTTAHTVASAEPANSLSRVRSGVIDGTTPGILIFGERPSPAPQAAEAAAAAKPAPMVVAAPPSTAAAPAAATPVSQPSAFERLGALLGGPRPLSGEPLNAAKGHESGSNGIELPTAGSLQK